MKKTHLGRSVSSGKEISEARKEEAEIGSLTSKLMHGLCKKMDLAQLHVLFK